MAHPISDVVVLGSSSSSSWQKGATAAVRTARTRGSQDASRSRHCSRRTIQKNLHESTRERQVSAHFLLLSAFQFQSRFRFSYSATGNVKPDNENESELKQPVRSHFGCYSCVCCRNSICIQMFGGIGIR